MVTGDTEVIVDRHSRDRLVNRKAAEHGSDLIRTHRDRMTVHGTPSCRWISFKANEGMRCIVEGYGDELLRRAGGEDNGRHQQKATRTSSHEQRTSSLVQLTQTTDK